MGRLLYIKSSPRDRRSHSHRAAEAFIEAYKQKNPQDIIETIDLFGQSLVEFDNTAAEAKYAVMQQEEKSEKQAKTWRQVEALIEQFKAADKYLFSVPMWNFGLPYKLKHYFDIIVQPGHTFTVGDNGYAGLVKGRPACVIYSRGGSYEPGSDMDLQSKYMELILRFIGFEDIRPVFCQPMLGRPDVVEKAQQQCITQAASAAESF